ncbi:hypothetical protein N7510_009103 [Penicillium lagena]|uniref:uncharacterized protein n=1 Tax=Penicillium lagena TaxID=94218 RepID=UPI00254064E5|nr:uncharacterized protein N7510_009103 [Penicillium lagena]KAJ5606322.1 hypothetical protein N7510_009103 [Penicillium lagena]
MFAQPFDHSFNDLFNQYVNMETSGADGNKDSTLSSDLDPIFPLDSLSSECGDLSPPISTSKRHRQSPQPWSQDWSLQGDGSADHGFAVHDTVHPSAISDLNFESSSRPAPSNRVSSTSPSTPPATPRRQATKSALLTPKSIRHRDPTDRRAPLRKQSFSPSLMRSANLQKGRMAYPEAWAQRIQNFNLHNSDDRLPLSPPPSDVLVQQENMPADHTALNQPRDSAEMPPQYDARLFHQSQAVSMPSPSARALARQQYLQSQTNSSTLTNSSSPSTDDIFSSSHSSDPQSLSSWHSDALGTPSLTFTPDLQSHDAQAWWSPMSSGVAQPQFASSAPQRPMGSVGNQNDMMQGGLMIQFDPSFDMPSAADSSFSSNNLHSISNNQESQYNVSTNHSFVTPFTTEVHTSRSPSLSPKAGSSPKDTRMKANHRRNHSRKLSTQGMSGPKPAKSSGSPRGANKAVSVSFVNFTSHDSKKILTGVAPSGSSKTKARREQEARDRRRKLSEAALKAVRNAGGDVEALEAVFC